MENILKISFENFKNYISNSNGVFFPANSHELILQSKIGSISYNFSDLSPCFCSIKFRRISGNGLVLISNAKSSKEYQISSQTVQEILFPLNGDNNVKLNRTIRSRGDISIFEINLLKDVDMNKQEWNIELRKAVSYRLLRLIDNYLMASSDANIIGNITEITTDPPNMYVRKENGVFFINSCKIISLKIDNEPKIKQQPYETFQIPTPVQVFENSSIQNKIIKNSIQIDNKSVYDTSLYAFNQSYCGKSAIATPQSVVIDFDGSYTIPMKMLSSNSSYTLAIDVEKIDGNGKFVFGILPETSSIKNQIAQNSRKTFLTKIETNNQNEFNINIWRAIASTGRIKITRIVLFPSNESLVPDYVPAESHRSRLPAVQSFHVPEEKISIPITQPINTRYHNDVMINALKYSNVTWNIANTLDSNIAWPCIDHKNIPGLPDQGYTLIINRDDKITKSIVSKSPKTQFVVLAARGKYPSNVFPINEYLKYEYVMDAVKKSGLVMDTVKSGLIDLADSLNIKTIIKGNLPIGFVFLKDQ